MVCIATTRPGDSLRGGSKSSRKPLAKGSTKKAAQHGYLQRDGAEEVKKGASPSRREETTENVNHRKMGLTKDSDQQKELLYGRKV